MGLFRQSKEAMPVAVQSTMMRTFEEAISSAIADACEIEKLKENMECIDAFESLGEEKRYIIQDSIHK